MPRVTRAGYSRSPRGAPSRPRRARLLDTSILSGCCADPNAKVDAALRGCFGLEALSAIVGICHSSKVRAFVLYGTGLPCHSYKLYEA